MELKIKWFCFIYVIMYVYFALIVICIYLFTQGSCFVRFISFQPKKGGTLNEKNWSYSFLIYSPLLWQHFYNMKSMSLLENCFSTAAWTPLLVLNLILWRIFKDGLKSWSKTSGWKKDKSHISLFWCTPSSVSNTAPLHQCCRKL